MQIPFHLTTFEDVRDDFIKWLVAKGAEIRDPTNEWEILRYKLGDVVSIIYRKKRGVLTYAGDSFEHIQEFLEPLVSYKHENDPASPQRFVQRACDPLPEWADDVRPFSEILEGWGSATDTARESTEHSSQPEDGGQSSADHSERLPWE